MLSYRRIKNLGLFSLVCIQLLVTLFSFVQIREKEQALEQLSDEVIVRYDVLERVRRAIVSAGNLFYYDSNQDFVVAENVLTVLDQCERVAARLRQLNPDPLLAASLQSLETELAQLQVAVTEYDLAEQMFGSDREILAGMIATRLESLLNRFADLQYQPQFSKQPANLGLLASLTELTQEAEGLFSQLEDSAIHQPETIVALLEKSLDDVALLVAHHRDSEAVAGTIRQMQDELQLLKLNLLNVYRNWDYDPNLSYVDDEIAKLTQAWENIRYRLSRIADVENARFAELRAEMSASIQASKLRFAVLALASLLVAFVVALLLSRTLQQRLFKLARGMQQYAAGNLDARVEVPGEDDLVLLADAFNDMAVELQRKDEELNQTIESLVDSQAELQEAHAQLELRVAERTRDLVSANEKLLLMGQVFEHAKEGILVADAEGRIIKVNPEFCRLTGFRAEQVLGKRPGIYRPQPSLVADEAIREQLQQQGSWEGELELNDPQGRPIPVLASISQYCRDGGEVAGRIGVFHDIRELKAQERMIRHQAYHDALTGLPNRLLLVDRLEVALSQARRHGLTVGILFLDLDNFKKINDSFGHGFGDLLLMHVAELLRETFREEDTICRIGGDEFVVVLGEMEDRARIHRLAERVLERVSGVHTISGREVHLGVSIGMATYPDNGDNVDDLLKNADIAMYSAKEHGKNVIHAFTRSMDELTQRRLALEEALWSALEEDQFELLYQPQLSTDGSRLCGAEALVRWNHPQRGLVSPAEFVPLCEETGQIIPLGHWVLRSACRFIVDFQARYNLSDFRIYVNVSPKQFADKNFLAHLHEVLAETGLNPAWLGVEITESSMMTDVDYAQQVVETLNRSNIAVAIDDFGTGYSSLAQLKNFPIQTLKIDRSFICDLPGDRSDEKIVETIIGMAAQLEIETVAEGVETRNQQQLLSRLGCSKIQGYLFSKPLPSRQFEAFVEQLPSPERQRSVVG